MQVESMFDLTHVIEYLTEDFDDVMDPVVFYTEGQCYILATAFWTQYGYPVRFLACHNDFGHVVNELPDGRIVDITGVSTLEDTLETWRGEFGTSKFPNVVDIELDPLSPGDYWVEHGWSRYRWFEDQFELAIDVVRELHRQMLTDLAIL